MTSPGPRAEHPAGILHTGPRLDIRSCPVAWKQAVSLLSASRNSSIRIDFSQLAQMDSAGVLWVKKVQDLARRQGKTVTLAGLSSAHSRQLAQTRWMDPERIASLKPRPLNRIQRIARHAKTLSEDAYQFISFFGQISLALLTVVIRPKEFRLNATLQVAEEAGVDALPIVALISFIVGLVMAFQAAMPMRMFGAEIYVANLIGIAMVRELGPLMTAIVLAGRSASAFAAEMGTMKINEEIDALTVMGLDPVRFLIVPRVAATILMTPLLALFANLVGILGGAVVILSLGYPLISYYRQIAGFVTLSDLFSGLVKCFFFGILIAVTGCIRGYQAKGGPSAVGLATTRAVVTSIILIAVVDGIFSVTYYYLGI